MLDELLELILEDAREHMGKTIRHLNTELGTIRAGRATPAMLFNIRVSYYGSATPLNQLATVSAPQPDLLVIAPWDTGSLKSIEQAIVKSNLGFNPSNDGTLIRVPVPQLTEERRRDLAKSARKLGEAARVSLRSIRRNAKVDIKSTQEEEHLSEDMRYQAEDELQKITNQFVRDVDQILATKEKDIMEV